MDLPFVIRIEPRQISKIKKLLYLLAVGVPFVPNIAKLAEATDISNDMTEWQKVYPRTFQNSEIQMSLPDPRYFLVDMIAC